MRPQIASVAFEAVRGSSKRAYVIFQPSQAGLRRQSGKEASGIPYIVRPAAVGCEEAGTLVTVEDVEEEEETEHLEPAVCAVGDWRENRLDGVAGAEECDGAGASHGAPERVPHQL